MSAGLAIPNIALKEPIGAGAFGQVYRGRHATLDIDVAVKLVNTAAVPDVDGVLKEARLMARLDHPNLLRIFDAGRANGALYLVLELMDGTCAGFRRLPPDRALDVTLQLLTGLQALHDARVLHRDIKPANCLVRTRDGRVKLADLGIAIEQTTRSRQVDFAGTLPFMAPELFSDAPQFSPASDLYALGVTIQCLVLDRDPFPKGVPAVTAWIQSGTPIRIADSRPDLPPALSALIDRLSARAVSRRPSTAAEAIASLAPSAAPTIVRSTVDPAPVTQIGSWVLGAEIPGDANFREYAVSHVRTGAAGRLAILKPRCPLSGASDLILGSAARASQLTHPGIADVIDWGTHGERAYVVTRSQGRNLKAIVESSGPIDELEAVELTRALADALAYLHGVGLVYQVVNPLFAVLAGDARSVQLAWPMFCVPIGSSAALSEESPQLISVPLFAAPESLVRPPRSTEPPASPTIAATGVPASIGGDRVIGPLEDGPRDRNVFITERVDLYGLGEILFYLIAGRAAYGATREIPALVYAKVQSPARLREAVPTVAAPTAQLVAELTDHDPAKRPASAAAVRDRLDRLARGLRA